MRMDALIDAHTATLRQDGRTSNEDAFLIRPGPPFVVAVADGAGNAEQAARQALRLLERSLASAGAGAVELFSSWAGWFRSIDAALGGGGETTLIALAVLDGRVLGAAAGDSRAYLWDREGRPRILTEGAAKQRLGSGRAVPFALHAPFSRGETLLLMTDGAWSPMPLTRLTSVVMRHALSPLAELPEVVLAGASRTGRADDMTVVAVRRR